MTDHDSAVLKVLSDQIAGTFECIFFYGEKHRLGNFDAEFSQFRPKVLEIV